jgi:Protein of unknown function (DUF3168)
VSTATRRAIYGKLAGDTTLNNLLASPPAGWSKSIFHYEAPTNVAFPFVIFSLSSAVPTEAFSDPSAYVTEVWLVEAVDRNTTADTAEAIAARIEVLLNDAALSISGGNLMYLRRQSATDRPELVDGVSYRHSGSLFRLVAEL